MKRARPKNRKRAEKKIELVQCNMNITENTDEAEDSSDYAKIIEEIQKEKLSGPIEETGVRRANNTKKSKKSAKKVVLTILAFLFLFVVIAMGTNLFDDNDILAPLEDGKINILLLGVDESGLRTDAIMVASYDVNEGQVNLLSVPRDTKVHITNKNITRKINAVHALSSAEDKGKILGVQASAEAVSQLTGIPINYYVEFSFSSIDRLFDSLGGVDYDVPDVEGGGRGMNYDDPYQNLHIHLKPGMQTLTGNQVQQFLRYRKSNYRVGTGSDNDRVKRQQEFVKAVIAQKMNLTLIAKFPSIFNQLSKEIKTNISKGDITKYIRHLKKLSGEKLNSFTLPGEDKTIGGASYFVCDLTAAKTLLAENFGVDEEISDNIVLSGKNPQKPILAGNMSKQSATQKAENAAQQNEVKAPEKEEKKEEEKPSELKKEDKKAEEEKTQTPPPPSNQTPLEDIYNLDE